MPRELASSLERLCRSMTLATSLVVVLAWSLLTGTVARAAGPAVVPPTAAPTPAGGAGSAMPTPSAAATPPHAPSAAGAQPGNGTLPALPGMPGAPKKGAAKHTAPQRHFDSPAAAFAAGAYDQALQGYTDFQVDHPEDPKVMFDIGSTQYKMRNWKKAEKEFSAAALRGGKKLREQALYNLGNVAYRTGRLDEAIERYQAALKLNPNDKDAKFNLEFVRNEIRRREQQAKKRQQQQKQGAGQKTNSKGGKGQKAQNQSGKQGQPKANESAAEQKKKAAAKEKPGAAAAAGKKGHKGRGGAAKQGELTRKQAERYLQGLEEKRPGPQQPSRRVQMMPPGGKDW